MSSRAKPVAVVLAGGRGRRLGGRDKAFVPLGARPLIAHVLTRLAPQASSVVISANGDPNRFAAFRLPVVGDPVAGHAGPLAGLLAGMEWTMAHAPDAKRIVTVAVDTPFIPSDLVSRLPGGTGGNRIAVARTAGRLHKVIGLFPISLRESLAQFLAHSPSRRVGDWLEQIGFAAVDFDTEDGFDPFFNVNTPNDLAEAERHLSALQLHSPA